MALANSSALVDAGDEGNGEMATDTRLVSQATTDERRFDVSLELDHGYQFHADLSLPGVAEMTLDEPTPLGDGTGPNPARLLAMAVANCLASSLLFCLRKARIEVSGMRVSAAGAMARNEKGRLRVTAIDVTLSPGVAQGDLARLNRCLEIFEDFCPVTAAVRKGVDVRVTVVPQALPSDNAATGTCLSTITGDSCACRPRHDRG